mmetsp:Transcript_83069/g.144247  ORF Transcript_83069/g.144247 Transcript_83069/m.144247 type:complete len:228 (-) Transcript_83069:1939-2622(-)
MCKLDDPKPIPKSHTEVDCKVLAINLAVERLGLVKALEISGYLGLLFQPVIQQPQSLHELDALIVLEADKGLLGDAEIELVQCSLGQQTPQSRMRIGLNIIECILQVGHLRQDVPRIAETLCLEVQQHLFPRTFRVLDYLVNENALDLEVLKCADVCVRQHRLLGLEATNDVHARLLHDGEEIGIVAGPAHIPDILALEFQLCACLSLVVSSRLLIVDVHERLTAGP